MAVIISDPLLRRDKIQVLGVSHRLRNEFPKPKSAGRPQSLHAHPRVCPKPGPRGFFCLLRNSGISAHRPQVTVIRGE